MNRYKFRFYIPHENVIYNPEKEYDANYYIYYEDGIKLSYISDNGTSTDIEDAVVMQWTGRNDKNKQMLYEGDIIKAFSFGTPKGLYHIVGYGNCELGYKTVYDNDKATKMFIPLNQLIVERGEIIGNVYDVKFRHLQKYINI